MYLIFDVSGTAQKPDFKANFTDTKAWPRLMHISWIMLDKEYKPMEDYDFIAIPEGFEFDEKSMTKAILDAEDIEKKSKPLDEILDKFSESVDKVEYVFAHNLNYNENILGAEYVRLKKSINLFKKSRFCLMEEGTYYCKLKGFGAKYKYPTLPELHAKCFGTAFNPVGNARADVIAATRCFIKMMKLGQLDDLFE